MAKQVQEAYIVAATRTPMGRSHRGYFRNTRPDDLLVKRAAGRAGASAVAGPARRLKTLFAAARFPKARRA